MMKDYKNCTGCMACQAICPKGAIESIPNKEGFYYPHIDLKKCVQCGLCDKICAENAVKDEAQISLCVQYKNMDMLLNATSGGAISALAETVLKKNGCVIAAEYERVDKGARWVVIESTEQLKAIQGSKYFQIPINKEIFEDIQKRVPHQLVLFIGTPCQVDAAKRIIKSNNFVTIDLICGGVASFLLEKAYIDYWTEKTNSNVIRHLFRKKVDGWTRDYYAYIETDSGVNVTKKGYSDYFNYIYNSGNCFRESCYNCKFTSLQRVGDFTVGDAWGIDQKDVLEFDTRKGSSLLMINSDKAYQLFNLMDNLYYIEAKQEIISDNKPLHYTSKRKLMRNMSYNVLSVLPLRLSALIINYRHTIKILIGRK